KIKKELSLLIPGLEREDSLIVALAGHGVQFKADKEPYFCPLDARISDKSTLISLLWLYDQLKYDNPSGVGCKPRQKLLLYDACRNNPTPESKRSITTSRGLASNSLPQIAPLPEGLVALFSCAEGQEAHQHEPLKHGVFFYHVLEGLKGKADGDRDRKITLDEVIAYTKSQTQIYARLNLAISQTPRQKGYFDGIWELNSLPDTIPFTNSIGMQLVPIQAGSFTMGSNDGGDNEKPPHLVTIGQAFFMQSTEVTQSQWQAVMGTKPWKGEVYVKEGSDYPATYVSWEDAVAFCQKLSQGEGKTYRLPTEAEWEYACRAGTTSAYSFGDDASQLSDYAWWGGILGDGNAKSEQYAHVVGTKKPNPWGLYDLHGNAYEWCSDWYDKEYYANSTARDPNGPDSGSFRVLRGGSWYYYAISARSSYRNVRTPDLRLNFIGFRVVAE
ncbi:MAG: hypothetical protein CMN21_10430, partial [Rubinisphaera sp.]